jgi:hypothetical protein
VRHWDDDTKDRLISRYVNYSKQKPIIGTQGKVFNVIAEKEREELEEKKTGDSIHVLEETKLHDKYVTIFNSYYGDTIRGLDHAYYDKYPGKLISYIETVNSVKQDPLHLVVGFGAGNFSSKLAFKATNIAIAGKYIEKFKYVSPEFRDHHLKITLRYYLKPISEHSMINFPNSVFNQLLGEYGIIGLILFFLFYVWFFLKHFRRLSVGRILLFMCLAFLLTDYWFESFNILIIFELMMFIDLATTKQESQNL